eukprot:SAG31_NODE_160_length_21908_cov_25.529048_7_plen_121_part_00
MNQLALLALNSWALSLVVSPAYGQYLGQFDLLDSFNAFWYDLFGTVEAGDLTALVAVGARLHRVLYAHHFHVYLHNSFCSSLDKLMCTLQYVCTVTDDNFEEVMSDSKDRTWILQFYAPW